MPPFAGFSVQSEKSTLHPFTKELDLRVNAKMNNFGHVDFASRDWTYDNDFALSRYAQEFPRRFTAEHRGYGKKTPKHVDLLD